MRLTAAEKYEIIQLVDKSELGINRTLKELGIHKSTYYKWYKSYLENNVDGLQPKKRSRRQWNSIPEQQKQLVIEVALDYPSLSPRELSVKLTDEQRVFISESSVYRILKSKGLITTPAYILLSAGNEFKKKTMFVHEMWQTDFTYFKILGWGWYYLSTILDDYSRYIVHWDLCTSMRAQDVQESVHQALSKAGLGKHQRPTLLSDNGSCYVSTELKDYLAKVKIKPIHGRVGHPQTQGKIERYHRSMKNVVKLDNYYHPQQLKVAIREFVDYYNYQRYHESLNNVTPADVYYGRSEQIIKQREQIKIATLKKRKQIYFKEKFLNLETETLSNN
jgi:transposase InsO family protein